MGCKYEVRGLPLLDFLARGFPQRTLPPKASSVSYDELRHSKLRPSLRLNYLQWLIVESSAVTSITPAGSVVAGEGPCLGGSSSTRDARWENRFALL